MRKYYKEQLNKADKGRVLTEIEPEEILFDKAKYFTNPVYNGVREQANSVALCTLRSETGVKPTNAFLKLYQILGDSQSDS